MPPFDHWSAKKALKIKGGKHRAAFWRKQGFPNLVRARAVAAANRERRKAAALASEQRERVEKQQQARSLLESTRDNNY